MVIRGVILTVVLLTRVAAIESVLVIGLWWIVFVFDVRVLLGHQRALTGRRLVRNHGRDQLSAGAVPAQKP